MIRVKICGITNPEDARVAVELGASAIGIVFWPKSPRCVERAAAREIVAAVSPLVPVVGVFVNQTQEATEIAHEVGLGVLQLHGDEPPASYRDLPHRVIKAIAVRDETAIEDAAGVPPSATVLLDAHDPIRRGGTGRSVNWSIAAAIARRRAVILSGGLNPDNVADAVAAVRPSAIDVSSGVEFAPRKKDHGKLRDLFHALRQVALDIHQ